MEAALAFMIAFAALSSANGVRDTEAAGLFFGQRHKPAFADALDTDIDLPVDRRQLQSTDGACDAGVHDYLKGDKERAPVIPYSTDCILKHMEESGRRMAPPSRLLLHLKGVPKSGTTWTEVVIKLLLNNICSSGLYPGCSTHGGCNNSQSQNETGSRWEKCVAEFGTQGDGGAIRLAVKAKHVLAAVGCSASASSKKSNSQQKQKKCSSPTASIRKWDNQPRWIKECLESKDVDYQTLEKCLRPGYATATPGSADRLVRSAAKDAETVKHILIIRDPRDIAVSWRYMHDDKDDATPIPEEKLCHNAAMWNAFFYYLYVDNVAGSSDTMELWYRRMIDHPKAEIVRIVEYLGLRASEEIIDKVVQGTSFQAMENMEKDHQLPGYNRPGEVTRKVRKGTYGSFRTEMSPSIGADCEEYMRRILPTKQKVVFDV